MALWQRRPRVREFHHLHHRKIRVLVFIGSFWQMIHRSSLKKLGQRDIRCGLPNLFSFVQFLRYFAFFFCVSWLSFPSVLQSVPNILHAVLSFFVPTTLHVTPLLFLSRQTPFVRAVFDACDAYALSFSRSFTLQITRCYPLISSSPNSNYNHFLFSLSLASLFIHSLATKDML